MNTKKQSQVTPDRGSSVDNWSDDEILLAVLLMQVSTTERQQMLETVNREVSVQEGASHE